ncbi:hypothetical protein F5Y16DRAFT_395673 [Xylariaceae sp. FL0255]|nr:hypothetical protein F5Y16DRAFT_395673 [Xylariaceae sp. FL0255]
MSEDVSRFLSQVKEDLGDRRAGEDEARSRELEEKILQDKKERQARRAERARSISPQKSSPANTPPPSTKRPEPERLNLEASPSLDPPSTVPLTAPPHLDQEMATANFPLSTSPSKENESPLDAEIKTNYPSSPTRSGTNRGLSWQRRPNSQASDRSRSRPLSMVAAENAARSSTSTPATETASDNLTRDQISSALASKDPTWFRQTADRGTGSAAYRRSQVEDTQTMDMSALRTQLPGMSRATSEESVRNEDMARTSSPATRNSIISNVPKLDPPQSDGTSDGGDLSIETRGLASPPPLGRVSPTRSERPISPTKGMGGFVQSAMMKRSDSVNKRWSVQQPKGLQRADSVASNRNSYIQASANPKTKPATTLRDSSAEPSRPSSSEGKGNDMSLTKGPASGLDTSTPSEPQKQDSDQVSPPISPSKTMDPRRWSPQKSSWLESALNKPDSPKPKPTPAPSNQPAWMAELQKAKAQKAANPSGEGSKAPAASHKHQVSIGGLMRSPALGVNTAAPPPTGRAGVHKTMPSISSNKEPQTPTTPSLKTTKSEPPKEAETIVRVPPTVKPKPETPPKNDFRANLKPRAPPPGTSTSTQQAEFKNVFGNLRKTTTQNYVAPDELKNNITRGKAALNITGGPQKTERKDEFKEAILAKKKEFQAVQAEGHGVTRNNSTAADHSMPEGLLKRTELGRSNTTKRGSVSSEVSAADARRPSIQSNRDSTSEMPDRFGSTEKRESVAESAPTQQSRPSSTTMPVTTREPFSSKSTASVDSSAKESNAPARMAGKLGGGALAARFNPALANLIARGPPPMNSSPGGNSTTSALSDSQTNSGAETNDNEAGSGPKLTHMTKNRARGPKRKAPTSSSTTTTTPKEEQQKPDMEQVDVPNTELETVLGSQNEVIALVDSSKKRYESPARPKPQPITFVGSSEPATELPIPTEVISTPMTGKTSNKIHEQVAAFAARRQEPMESRKIEIQPKSPPPTQSLSIESNVNKSSRFGGISEPIKEVSSIEKPKSPKPISPAKGFLGRTSQPDLSPKPQPPSPSNKPKAMVPEPLSLTPRKEPLEGEAMLTPSQSDVRRSAPLGARPLPSPSLAASRGSSSTIAPSVKIPEPLSRPLPSPGPSKPSLPPASQSPSRSPTKKGTEITATINDFFGSDRPQRSYKVDAADILMQRPNQKAPQIEDISSQMFQFSPEGKKQPVPAHHSRTLFEREMYLCAHTFKNEAGKKVVAVYFWAGDEVPESVVEDATIFVAREARALGGTLVKMRQGKETSEFIQALGGVVITQRGSGNKYDSLAPHMLCGRRYRGHIVFDEVDFTPAVLCSGFPYLITQTGKCYLWKGKGSGVDELSCARLIGMDYALTGEMEEVEEGRESTTFWDLFGGANRYGSADHWRLKPNYDKYCSRLFLSDAASKQQVTELPHVVQTDLQTTNVYVIDAFFELYIVVGSQAQAQYASFHNALEFAQEYAILAAGMEDRPFVPISSVVLEGVPRDMKSVFRKWQDSRSPTVTNPNAGLKRGRSLKVVTLNQALQALSE